MEDSVIYTDNKILGKTFFWMFLGLLSTGFVAWYTYASGYIDTLISGQMYSIILIIELAVAISFSLLFRKLSSTAVAILYFIYAFVNGVTFSTIFALFELNSIIYLFFVTAGIFGILSFIGYSTKKDLSNWSTYLFPLLLAGLIISLINIFLQNSYLDIILDWAILILFFAITIYDINKIKTLQNSEMVDTDKIHIYGAMQLYLDFINIFLRILYIFAKRRD